MANFENFSNPYSRNLLLNNLKRICKSIMHMPIHMSIFLCLFILQSFFFWHDKKKLSPKPFLHLGIILYLCSEDPVCYCSQHIERFTVKRGDYNEVSHCYLLLFLIHHGVVTSKMLDLLGT